MDAYKIFQITKSKLILQYPFFGTLAIYLTPQEDKSIETCGTDGEKLYFSPDWIIDLYNTQGINAITGVLCHEVLHCALGHLWRIGSRHKKKWNTATDIIINHIIETSGMELPKNRITAAVLLPFLSDSLDDYSAEEVYEKLPDLFDDPAFYQNWGDHSKWEKNKRAKDFKAEEWESRLNAVSQTALGRGDLPSSLKKLIDDTLKPQVDWRSVLAEWLQPFRCEYIYVPQDRRFIHEEIYIPDFGGKQICDLVIAIDTSGSTFYGDIIDKFIAECKGILSMNNWTQLHVAYCDAALQNWETLKRDEWPELELRGGGGTSFVPVFEEVGRRAIDPVALVYLTDGWGKFPNQAPYYPVLWVVSPDGIAEDSVPFGRAIKMSRD